MSSGSSRTKIHAGKRGDHYELEVQKKKKKTKKLSARTFRLNDRGFLLVSRAMCLMQKRVYTHHHSMLVRYFTTWCYMTKSHPLKIPNVTPEQTGQLVKTRATILSAFKEYEEVASKYHKEFALFEEKVQTIKTENGCKLILITMHLRYLNTLKSAFEKIKVFAAHREDIVSLKRDIKELNSAMEKVNVTQTDIKEIEEINSKLQITLLVKLSVQRLRIHASLTTLYSTRERNRNMRKVFYDEVTAIKGALQKYDDTDAALFENCVAAKEEYFKSLHSTRTHLVDALKLHTALKMNFDDAISSQMQVEKEAQASRLATGAK